MARGRNNRQQLNHDQPHWQRFSGWWWNPRQGNGTQEWKNWDEYVTCEMKTKEGTTTTTQSSFFNTFLPFHFFSSSPRLPLIFSDGGIITGTPPHVCKYWSWCYYRFKLNARLFIYAGGRRRRCLKWLGVGGWVAKSVNVKRQTIGCLTYLVMWEWMSWMECTE